MSTQTQPSPALFFETANAFMRTAALKAAVELNLFTAIGNGLMTATEVGGKIGAPERSTRILCDYLTVLGFLAKQDGHYSLTPDSALFPRKWWPPTPTSPRRFAGERRFSRIKAQLRRTIPSGWNSRAAWRP